MKDERQRFVNMSRANQFGDDDEEIQRFTTTQRNKIQTMLDNQDARLPKVSEYKGPVIATHNFVQRVHNFVVTNDAHIKATNNGFKRQTEDGRFFNH